MTEANVLPRTGDRPLAFSGDLIATATTKTHDGPGSTRWWELSLFKPESKQVGSIETQRWVLHVAFKTQWQGELYQDSVIVADSADELTREAKAFPFLKSVRGYPKGQDERQNRLVEALTARWNDALSVILGHLGPERL